MLLFPPSPSRRTYAASQLFWGGGTVALATSNADFHVLKCRPADKLEDGTVNFLDIIALKHGFAMFDKLGGIGSIQSLVASLTEYLYGQLSGLKHSNGRPMLEIFGKHDAPDARSVQGGILNFELLKPNGGIHSYRTFEMEAAEAGFHVRTGAACNPGACYAELGVQVRRGGWVCVGVGVCVCGVGWLRGKVWAPGRVQGELSVQMEVGWGVPPNSTYPLKTSRRRAGWSPCTDTTATHSPSSTPPPNILMHIGP
jgi:hypothetical protein